MRQGFRGQVMLPRVHRVQSGGRVLRYHRPTKTRLPDLPEDHPDFIAAWLAAEGGKAARQSTGALARLIEDTRAGRHFRELSPGYRAMMTTEMESLHAAYGALNPAALRPRHINADMAQLAAHKAGKRLRAWRLIFAHALQTGLIETDPSAGIRKPATRSDGYAPWSGDDVALFREKVPIGTTARACFELLFWTAARTVDAVVIGRAHVGSDGVLAFRQSKTEGFAYVPWTCAMPAWCSHWEAERADMHRALERVSGGFTFLEARGRARSKNGLSNLIAESARNAGLADRTAHGLRKARLTAIAEAGGTTQAIMSWGGHKSLSEAEKYTRSVSRKSMVMGTDRDRIAVNPATIAVNPVTK